jgi:hypothetical protein
MTLRYLLDEQLRGPLWNALRRHNAGGLNPVDAERVGDPADLPLGATDPDILLWAEREVRILLSRDFHTMPPYLAAHLRSGHRCPGVFLLRVGLPLRQIVDALVYYAHAGDPQFVQDRCEYIP